MTNTNTTTTTLAKGDRVLLSEKRQWTVRAVTERGRFAILTQPFNLQRTVLYTVIDFKRGVRGKDDHYGLGYETAEDIDDALKMFQNTEDDEEGREGRWHQLGHADVSYRTANHVPLVIRAINGERVTGEWS